MSTMRPSRPAPLLPTAACLLLATIFFAGVAGASLDRVGALVFSQYSPDDRFDLASQPESADQIGRALATGDFNGDGYRDLAIGVPFEDLSSSDSSIVNSGWVSVIYGTADGLDASPGFEDVPWDQEGPVQGGPEPYDFVGWAVAVGDFNGDGYDDLAMGVPGEDVVNDDTGAVNVLYGSAEGLQTAGNRMFWQGVEIDGNAVPGSPEEDDRFGDALAVGDFDGDGRDDLAIGVPWESIGSVQQAGGVVILYGRAIVGLDPEGAQGIHRNSPGMRASPSFRDFFGEALATGDFDGDGRDDLAIGVSGDDRDASNAGAVDVVYGSPQGLDTTRSIVVNLNDGGVAGGSRPEDYLGVSLASGDFDGDGYADLAAGLPYRSTDSTFAHGAVLTLYGTATGLQAARSQLLQQGDGGLADAAETEDFFGISLATGDLDGDGRDELVVGVPGEDANGFTTEPGFGAAHVIYGSPQGLETTRNELLDGDALGMPDRFDNLGRALALGDFNGDGADDLAVSAPSTDVVDPNGTRISSAGEVVVVPGIPGGGPCLATPTTLCLNRNRFEVEVEWTTASGFGSSTGIGIPRPRTSDSGFFWFFDPDNIELVVKVLDARAVNGHFWVFYGSLSNVAYEMRVTDLLTDRTRTYRNPQGRFASAGDTSAFIDTGAAILPADPAALRADLPTAPGTAVTTDVPTPTAAPLVFDEPAEPEAVSAANTACGNNQLALCLGNDRFFVTVDWRDFQGNTGDGNAVPVTDDTGAFWFFDEANLELVLKVLDARAINGHYWVYFGALSNVAFDITVLDTDTGRIARYSNPLGTFASQGDTEAIPE